jgi:copper chaperone
MTVQFTVPDMSCSVCAGKIEKAVHTVDPSAGFAADTTTKLVTIATNSDRTQLQQAIQAAGYNPQ